MDSRTIYTNKVVEQIMKQAYLEPEERKDGAKQIESTYMPRFSLGVQSRQHKEKSRIE